MTHPDEATLRKRTKLIVGVVFTVLARRLLTGASAVDRQVGQGRDLSDARASRLPGGECGMNATSRSFAVGLVSLVLATGCGGRPTAAPAPTRAPPSSRIPAVLTTVTLPPTTTTVAVTTTRATTTTMPDPCANANIEAGTRLKSGVNVDPGRTGGLSQLNIENGSSLDATVKLVGGGALVRHIFVRASTNTSTNKIPPGKYRLLVSQGKIWNANQKQFQCNRQAFEYVGGADFSETATAYSVLTITLQPTAGGTAPTKSISPDAFNGAT